LTFSDFSFLRVSLKTILFLFLPACQRTLSPKGSVDFKGIEPLILPPGKPNVINNFSKALNSVSHLPYRGAVPVL
jgi:hypothetical protein